MDNKEATEKILNIRVNYSEAIQGIAEYQKKIDAVKEREKELALQLKAGKVSRAEYRKEMAAIREATKEYQGEIRLLSREVQNDIKLQKAQEGSLSQLRQFLSDAKKSYVEMSKAERESAKGKELQQHILSLNNEIKDMEAEIGVFSRNVGNYEEAIKNALGLNNKFADSLMNMTKKGGGIKGMFSEASVSAKAFLTTLTGFLTNPVFLALAGIAGAGVAFKWWFDYNKGLAEATRLTREFLDLHGDRLKAVRNEIQATADVYGKDYREVLETVDALVAQYGLTAEQAMTVIQDGFQAGADESGNMLNKVKELAPQFHDAGIAADEMMAIMAQTRSGIFSEGGMDIIAMASKKIREMATGTADALNGIGISSKQVQADLESGAKSTFDVIQEVSGKLRELPQDSQEVGNVLKDVFGRQGAAAGLQLIEQLDTMTKDIEEVKEETGEYGEATRKQIETQKELNNVVSAMFDVTSKGFEESIINVKTYVMEGLVNMLQWMVKAINYTIDWYNNSMILRAVINSLVTSFKFMWNAAKLAFNLIINAVKDTARSLKGLGYIVEGIFTFNWGKIKQGFELMVSNIAKSVTEAFNDMWGFVKDTADDVSDYISDTFGNKKLPPITIPVTVDNPEIPDVNKAGNVAKPARAESGPDTKKDDASVKRAAKERECEEREEARHQAQMAKIFAEGEKRMLALITSNLARQRQALNVEYNNQIADLKNKLATEAKLTEEAKRSLNAQIIALEQEKQRKLREFDEGRVKSLAEAREKELTKEIELTKEGTQKRLELVKQQLSEEYENRRVVLEEKMNEQASYILEISREISRATEEGKTEDEIAAIEKRLDVEQSLLDSFTEQKVLAEEEYRQKVAEVQDEFDNAQMEKVRQVYQNQIDELMLKDDRTVEEGRKVLELQHEQAEEYLRMLQERGETEMQTTEEYNEQVIAAKQKLVDSEKAIQEYESSIEQSRLQAASAVTNGLVKLTSAIGQSNKEMAQLSKLVTLAQIAIDTGKAISSGVASASSLPYPSNLVAIATTVGTVLTNVATAISTVNSAKFAKGGVAGIVNGKYDDDKDRLLIRVNKGEMILNSEQQKRLYKALTGKDENLTEATQQELFGIADGQVEQPAVVQDNTKEATVNKVESAAKRSTENTLSVEQKEVIGKMISDDVEVALVETAKNMSVHVGSESVLLSDEQRKKVKGLFSEELDEYKQRLSEEMTESIGEVSGNVYNKTVLDEGMRQKLYSFLSEDTSALSESRSAAQRLITEEQQELLARMMKEETEVAFSNFSESLSLRVGEETMTLTQEQREKVEKAFTQELVEYHRSVMKEASDNVESATEKIAKKELQLNDEQRFRLSSVLSKSLSDYEQNSEGLNKVNSQMADEQRLLLRKMESSSAESALVYTMEPTALRVGDKNTSLSAEQRKNIRNEFEREFQYFLEAVSPARTDSSTSSSLEVSSKKVPLNFLPITDALGEIGNIASLSTRQINDTVAAESDMVDQMAESIENLPNPVVSVEDINNGQRRVEVIENIDSL